MYRDLPYKTLHKLHVIPVHAAVAELRFLRGYEVNVIDVHGLVQPGGEFRVRGYLSGHVSPFYFLRVDLELGHGDDFGQHCPVFLGDQVIPREVHHAEGVDVKHGVCQVYLLVAVEIEQVPSLDHLVGLLGHVEARDIVYPVYVVIRESRGVLEFPVGVGVIFVYYLPYNRDVFFVDKLVVVEIHPFVKIDIQTRLADKALHVIHVIRIDAVVVMDHVVSDDKRRQHVGVLGGNYAVAAGVQLRQLEP